MEQNERIPLTHILPVIAGCGLIGTCLGIGVNISGNFFTPIADSFGIGRGAAAATLTVYNLVFAVSAVFAPRFHKRIPFRLLLVIGTILQAGGTFLLSLCNSILPMYVLHAFRGLGSGMIGTVTVTMMINYWFQNNTALMTSITLGSSGVIGAVLSPLVSSIIANSGWRAAYMAAAGIALLFNLPSLLLPISLHPEDRGLSPYGTKQEPMEESVKEAVPVNQNAFLSAMVFSFACSLITALPQHFPGIAETKGLLSAGALMISASMIANTAGKVMFGALIDRLGTLRASDLFLVLISVGAFLLLNGNSSFLLILSALLFGLCFSVSVITPPVLSRELFGMGNYSRVYPKLNFMATAANAIGTWLIGYLYDGSGSYSGSLILVLVLLLGSILTVHLAFWFGKRKPDEARSS